MEIRGDGEVVESQERPVDYGDWPGECPQCPGGWMPPGHIRTCALPSSLEMERWPCVGSHVG